MNELEKVLKALANRRRLLILKCLKRGEEHSVTEIAAEIQLSLRSTSRHLKILAAADIIDKDQRGLEVFYRLAKNQKVFVSRVVGIL